MFMEIRHIKKSFGEGESRVEVLKGIDLDIEKGEFCVLLGPSGSGKSTLLNIIGGIDRADEGSIRIDGEPMADMDRKRLTLYRRRHLGYIFQMYNLIPNLTVRENIEVGAYLGNNPLEVDGLLHTLGLYEHRNKLPNQLSGGQQQRTAIGRAIVKNPDILLCDEPTGALDYHTSREILKLIETVNRRYGNTVIMVTHNDAIKYMADRVVGLRDGSIRKNYRNRERVAADALEDYVPRYLNQAIQFTGEDMGSDKAMMIALLYILIVIIAFVFGITMSSTVSREANVIGTLLASGFRRGELFRHYMAAPLCVTAAGALAGNILGYTVFRMVCAGMYYGSYSLPTYVTVWNGEAFFLTTVIPLLLMGAVSGVVLWWKLRLPPLCFLRRDIAGSGRRRALPLPAMIPFFGRFRVRVILQNISNYAILLVGILFANLLLMFGLLLPAVLVHHQEEMEQNMLCPYQYILRPPLGMGNEERRLEGLLAMLYFYRMVETEQESAEKFSAWTLNTLEGAYKSEEVLLYGIDRDSRYISLEVGGDEVYISSAYADKFGIGPGDTVTLKEPYEDTQYSFTVTGIYNYNGALALFMGREYLNKTFDLDGDYFGGYFSDTEIHDIDSEYIGLVIDLDALTKISRQLMVSMGNMMYLVDGFAIVMFAAIMYLLSKIIIEKNAQSISMAKILGYTDREIVRLYILPTLSVTVFFLIATMPVEYGVMAYIFRVIMMNSISGWIPLYVDPVIYVKMFFLGLLACGAVTALEYRRVGRVPMGEALKNVE